MSDDGCGQQLTGGGAAHDALADKIVLFVVNDLRYFFTHRLPLAAAVRDAGGRVGVVTPPSQLVDQVLASGFDYFPVRLLRNANSIVDELRVPIRLASLYRTVRPHLVHHITTKPVLYGSCAARLTKVPAVVNTVAGLGYVFMNDQWRTRVLRRGVTAAYRSALAHKNSITIFQNGSDLSSFVQARLVSPLRAVLVRGSGVDIEQFAPSCEPTGVPIVVLASRMLRDKGVGDFVEAARILRGRSVSCRCVLVGSPDPGNPTSIPENTLREWQADGSIEWWGESSDMPHVMASATIVVLPSYREGLPKVLLEAAASARPIVTNDVPGCRDAVENGRTGLLVPPRDPDALAAAIQHLLEDRSLRRRMGKAGRALVEQSFAQGIIVRQTLDIYSNLLTAPKP